MDRAKPEEGTYRKHLEATARGGDQSSAAWALRKLEIPPCPEEVEHLVAWTYDLHGRDGFNMGGANLLSNTELESFFRLRGIVPDPLEVDALMLLNAAYCNPEGGEEDEDGESVPRETIPPQTQPGRQIVAA